MAAPMMLAGFAVSAAMGMAGGVVDAVSGRKDAAQGANKLREQADEFEKMFLEQMLDRVFSAGGDEGMMAEAGPGAEVYRSMLSSEYAGLIARGGGIGLSDQVYAQLLKLQEG